LTPAQTHFNPIPPVLAPFVAASPLSDSLPIEGHYSQGGHSVGRGKLEKFLLSHDTSALLTDHSIKYKWSGHAIGAALWCVDIGVSAYQLKLVLDALKNQNRLLDSTGKQFALSNDLYKFTVPLFIGGEVASFVQERLYNRSDYLLHKSALAFNASLAKKFSPDSALDLCIEKAKSGGYTQGGLFMTEPALYGVLREQPGSRAISNWSATLKEIGRRAGEWGGMYIGLALLSYLQEAAGDSSMVIDKKARDLNLTIGVSLASFGIVDAIVSIVTKNIAIKKYNEGIPKRVVRTAPATPTITVEPIKALADTTGTIQDTAHRPLNPP
jgi:hypothetical protein